MKDTILHFHVSIHWPQNHWLLLAHKLLVENCATDLNSLPPFQPNQMLLKLGQCFLGAELSLALPSWGVFTEALL